MDKQLTTFQEYMSKKRYPWYISENDRTNLIFLINEVLKYYSSEYEDEYLAELNSLIPELENLPGDKR